MRIEKLFRPRSVALDHNGLSQRWFIESTGESDAYGSLLRFKDLSVRLLLDKTVWDHVFHTKSRVLLIIKVNNPTTWGYYRPISVLPAWLATLEKIKLAGIKKEIQQYITPYQYGFRENSSCNKAKFWITYQA